MGDVFASFSGMVFVANTWPVGEGEPQYVVQILEELATDGLLRTCCHTSAASGTNVKAVCEGDYSFAAPEGCWVVPDSAATRHLRIGQLDPAPPNHVGLGQTIVRIHYREDDADHLRIAMERSGISDIGSLEALQPFAQ